ncbi:MAG: bifunctional sulfate adenylyltransferase/adenylylsulfate kinase [Candidatus Latescibacteria bacterium]|nr:bifunctional sulfate adenylyltransferase/adenylylsulfate kinase [Candidatus Latescibacterota bacterium]
MSATIATLIEPYCGELSDLVVDEPTASELKDLSASLPSRQLSDRAVCDLELLANGGFSPLIGFMGEEDFQSVLDEMRLKDGTLFPIPVTLPVEVGDDLDIGRQLALRDSKNNLLAVMDIEEIYRWNCEETAAKAFGTTDAAHPIVAEMRRWPKMNIAGRLQVLQLPIHHDFAELRPTPSQVRDRLERDGHENVVAFQTRNPMHRVHEELTKRATDEIDGVLLLHPVVGMTKPGDVDYFTRVRTYKALADNHYDPDRIVLSLLPLAMRMGGPREALWHMIIRRNYGANHLIVGRDHAGPGNGSDGEPIYGPYDAMEAAEKYSDELGVGVVPFKLFVHLPEEDRYEDVSVVAEGTKTESISGTQVRDDYLNRGRTLPGWFTRPEVADILADAYPPRHQQGVCIWMTGLSGSGKSTVADVLLDLLQELGRRVTVLDGDVVRTNLSKGLGFSKEDRDTNILRIGYVASEIVKHGGVAICAAISPYIAVRDQVREMVGEGFVEVFVDTPLSECEKRDVKGMYAKARRGEIKGFTGIDDPYEAPENPEMVLDTIDCSGETNGRRILDWLVEHGYVRASEQYLDVRRSVDS